MLKQGSTKEDILIEIAKQKVIAYLNKDTAKIEYLERLQLRIERINHVSNN